MDFRILGALEVWDGAERVEISGRLHPRILAGLLLNSGRAVALSWLVDLLWDNDPPATARRQVQNAVAALRRQLAPVREGLIERIGQDYRINLAADELDLRRFETAVRSARGRAESEARREALDGFENALDLWRGPALSGQSGRILEAAATRLDDTYLSTYEEYAELALGFGEPERVLPRLHELTMEHPLRQRLIARLMHALYQARRAPEALRVFENLRAVLAEELGIDPGPELKELHLRILQEDQSLLPRPERQDAAPARSPVPAQLPTDVASFTGRSEQLAALDRLRDSGARAGIVSAITGIGGVGKTALAVHWGHSRREDFPDGQLYINLRGFDEREPLTPHEAVSRLLRSLGHPGNDIPADLDEASTLYRSLLADKRMLVVLDNARTVEQVRPLLPASAGCLAIVTSRNRLSSLLVTHDAQPVELNTLSPDESIDLLANLLGPGALDYIETTKRVCELCGHLPLALRIVAANLSQNPHKTLAVLSSELEGSERLNELAIDNDNATSITAIFDLSYRELSCEAKHIFEHLGLIPGDDFTTSLGAAITNSSNTTLEHSFQELVNAQLLDNHQQGRYRFHDLIRLYAQKLSTTKIAEESRATAINRLVIWYSDWSNSLFQEFNNIIAVCDTFHAHPQMWKIVSTFTRFAAEENELETPLRVAESALKIADARQNVEAKINILATLGTIHDSLGNNTSGVELVKAAVNLLPRVQDKELHGRIRGNLGGVLYRSGAYSEAEVHLRQALHVAEETGDRMGSAIRVGNLGRVCRAMGRFHEAQTYLTIARDTATEENMPHILASALLSLGNVYLNMGQPEKALPALTQALEISEEIGAIRTKGLALHFTGKVLHALDRSREALEYFDKALSIAREGHRVGFQNDILERLVEVHLDLDDVNRANTYLAACRALSKTRPTNNSELAGQSSTICRTLCANGEYREAVQYGSQACEIYRTSCPDPLRLANALDTLAEAYRGNGDQAKATECWTEALDIFTRLDVPEAGRVREKLRTRATS